MYIPVRNGIFPATPVNKERSSPQQLQPQMGSWWPLRELEKERMSVIRLLPLPTEWAPRKLETWKQDPGPENWGTYQSNDFSGPRFLYLPIHRKALHSLTGDTWFSFTNNHLLGLAWWCSGCQSVCQSRGHRLDPGSRKIPETNWAHAPQLLIPCSRAQEPQLLKPMHLAPMLRNQRSHFNEKPVQPDQERTLLITTKESPSAATKIQHNRKQIR